MRKIQGHLPLTLWSQYEEWAEERGKIQMRQLLAALFKLFLGVPEGYKAMALYGKGETFDAGLAIHQTVLEALSAAEDRRRARAAGDPLGAIWEIVGPLEAKNLRHLSPAERKVVLQIKASAAPDAETRTAVADEAAPGGTMDCENPLDAISRILEESDEEGLRLLSPEESAKLEKLKRDLAGKDTPSKDKSRKRSK